MHQLGLQKACSISKWMQRMIFFLPKHVLKDTIWLADFLSKEISLAGPERTMSYNLVLSESADKEDSILRLWNMEIKSTLYKKSYFRVKI